MMVTDSIVGTDGVSGIAPKRTAIRVRDLWKKYGTLDAVWGINLEINDGEIFGLIGPDGAGKTTTFQILAGVMEATLGQRLEYSASPAREVTARTPDI